MEDRTFHPFPRLPKELRDAIWALAIRPKKPSAHFFTVFDCAKDAEWWVLSQYSIRHRFRRRCGLAAPASRTSDHHSQEEQQQQQQQRQEQQFSWVQGSRSGYLIDSGLWTACTESRAVMERRFKVAEWDIKREALRYPRNGETCPDAPATVSFTSNGEWQCCLTHPRTDLFFLEPFDAETADWEHLDRSVPIFNTAERFYVGHVAIDYDPGWLGGANFLPSLISWASDGTVGFSIRTAIDLHWAENLWLVDYRIRRKQPALPTTPSRHQFQGNGCRFTEVQEHDAEWELSRTRDVFIFLKELWMQVDEYYRERADSPSRNEPVSHDAPEVGILAYEEV